MIKCENIGIYNIENAIRGMRNPLNSWDKSDSYIQKYPDNNSEFIIGSNDMILAQKLIKAGTDERKFMRQIFISIDITAPRYWWPEMDQYKVSTVTNSTSTMHKLLDTEITEEMFSYDRMTTALKDSISWCEYYRLKYLETKDKQYWRTLIEILPQSFLQKRTWTANYETLRNIYHARKNHKLQEWKDFCTMIETLPYAKELICI